MKQHHRTLELRRRFLHAWADAWYRNHERDLASEGVSFGLRVGRRTFWVTSEQALAAMTRTLQELDRALVSHSTWGVDEHGRASEPAMCGLINRRLASRLVDQLRRADGVRTQSLSSAIRPAGKEDITLTDTLAAPSGLACAETMLWLRQVLCSESPETREVIVRRLARETSDEISSKVGLSPAATRQRISRFRRQHAKDLLDVA